MSSWITAWDSYFKEYYEQMGAQIMPDLSSGIGTVHYNEWLAQREEPECAYCGGSGKLELFLSIVDCDCVAGRK